MADKYLRQLVIDELDFEPSVDAANIGVAVERRRHAHGPCWNSCREDGRRARSAACQGRARHRRGDPSALSVGRETADDQIAERAINIISWDAQIPKDAVMVKVQKGWVTLTGSLPWNYQKVAAYFGHPQAQRCGRRLQYDRGQAARADRPT